MAWLTNLAGKAEDLLNRLDHNASIVLLQNESKDVADLSNLEMNNEAIGTTTKVDENNSPLKISSSENVVSKTNIESSKFVTEFNIAHEIDIKHPDVIPESVIIQKSSNDYINLKATELEFKLEQLEKRYSTSQNDIIRLKKVLTDYEGQNTILKDRLKQSLASLSFTQEEVEKQRNKAQKILEDKERLVAQIENVPMSSTESNIENVSKLIKNRDEQQKTIDELTEKLELVQTDLAATQRQCSLLEEETITAKQTLQKDEKFRLAVEDELVQNKQELNKIYEDLKHNMCMLNSKNEELICLKKQIESRNSVPENEELESKFHVLTKTLIMKQNSLETLTTERNALRLQLERTEKDYSKALVELKSKQTASVLNIDNFNENKSQSYFTISPFDEGVTRKVKRAISTLNSFSIRLGVFLRRYPVARVFLLCYMILLQIWVVVILFAYVPNSN